MKTMIIAIIVSYLIIGILIAMFRAINQGNDNLPTKVVITNFICTSLLWGLVLAALLVYLLIVCCDYVFKYKHNDKG